MGDDSRRAGNRVEYLVMPEGKKVHTHTSTHTSTHKHTQELPMPEVETTWATKWSGIGL